MAKSQTFKFIHTSDWHLWDKHIFSIDNSRLKKIVENIKKIIDFAIERKVDVIFVSGDLTHTYNPDERLLNELAKLFKYAAENGILIRAITGNHDTNGINHGLESFQNLLSISNDNKVKIYSPKPDIVSSAYMEYFKKQIGDGIANRLHVAVHYVPYQENLISAFEGLSTTECFNNFDECILVTHCGVSGGVASTGKKLKSDIKTGHFRKWSYVALGDYHKYQKLAPGIYYSGSVIRNNRGEKNDKKGFNYVIIKKEEHRKSVMKIKKIELDDIEMIDVIINYKKMKDTYKKISSIKGKSVKDAVISLFIKGDIGTGEKLISLKAALMKGGASQINSRLIESGESIKYINDDTEIKLSLDVSDACSKFAKRKEVDDHYIKYGVDKINSVR